LVSALIASIQLANKKRRPSEGQRSITNNKRTSFAYGKIDAVALLAFKNFEKIEENI